MAAKAGLLSDLTQGWPLPGWTAGDPRFYIRGLLPTLALTPVRRSLMTDIVIASAARTPVGAFNGGLASLPAHKLGEVAIAEALRRAHVEPQHVSEVIMVQI